MALKLNLHHEIEKQRALQRRDPLKIATAGIIAIVIAFAGYYLYQLEAAHSTVAELDALKSEFASLNPKAEAAQKREEELNAATKVSDSMVNRVEGRFYWAPVLGALCTVVPPQVQIAKFTGDVSGDRRKHCSMTVEGVAAGVEPRKTAEELRKALADSFSANSKYRNVTSVFKTLDETTEIAKVAGRQLPTVEFTIFVQLDTGAEDAPPAAKFLGRKGRGE
jgi:hypothetical protein